MISMKHLVLWNESQIIITLKSISKISKAFFFILQRHFDNNYLDGL